MLSELAEVGVIVVKVYGTIIIINLVLVLLMLVFDLINRRRKNEIRQAKEREAAQSERDDHIFEEVDRFYGAPW